MAMPQPKRWWFVIPLPGAMLLSALLDALRNLDFTDECALYLYIAVIPLALVLGIGAFPIGLAALFSRDAAALQHYFTPLVCCGYGTYALLTLWGIIRPHRIVFLILCMLLLANVAGCQLEHVVKSIPIAH